MGTKVTRHGNDVSITPFREGQLKEPRSAINCGSSATTMRLLTGLLAPGDFTVVLTGDTSLGRRPMDRVIIPLRRMGAVIQGRGGDRYPPLIVIGNQVKPIDYTLPIPSAQVKSSLLLAGLRGGVEVVIRGGERSRDHLEILLKEQGIDIRSEGGIIRFCPGAPLGPVDMVIPGDPSSAAFFIVLALLVPGSKVRVKNVLLNPTRTGFLDALVRMGANIEIRKIGIRNGEEIGDIVVVSSDLVPTSIENEEIPSIIDEVPALAVAAVRARGVTDFSHLGELRVKESDRITSISENLRAIGVEVEDRPDGFSISGTRRTLRGKVTAFRDHRIAMAFSILGASPGVDLEIEGWQCAKKSFPSFFDHLEAIARRE
jgi:3-phosphoshikimate 1-carboxyvinyltransferase